MAAINLAAQAQQAAAKGQQMLQNDQNNAAQYKGQYNQYQQQADAANSAVKNYTGYMQGAGSAGNQYDQAFNQQKTDLGYDPAQMTTARNNLNQAVGALSAYNDFAGTGAAKWGMNAGGFAAANSGALQGLNNNIQSNQNVVNGLSDLYKTAQTGANQKTGLVIQGEHETLGGLQNTFQNIANQRDSAASMMNFYDNLASQQGGLNAQQQQYYAQAQQAYAASQAALAQAGLYGAQADQIRQQISMANAAANQGSGGSSGARPSAPVKNAAPAGNSGGGYSFTNPSSSWHALTNTLGNNPSLSNTARGIGDAAAAGVSGLGWLGNKIWNGF
jgi:hypothetical protein